MRNDLLSFLLILNFCLQMSRYSLVNCCSFRSNPVRETDYHKLESLAKEFTINSDKLSGDQNTPLSLSEIWLKYRPTGDSKNADKVVWLKIYLVASATDQKLLYIKLVS